MESEIPKRQRVVLSQAPDKPLVIGEDDIPTPGPGEVLIKVAYSTINPIDLAAISRSMLFGRDPNNLIPGFEGSGTVVAAGEGVKGASLIGKKVAFLASMSSKWGSWAEYTLVPAASCFQLPDIFDLKHAAAPFINPLTVVCIFQTILQHKSKAIVQSAAGSALGKMIIRICREHGVKTINIVRKDSYIEELRSIGGDVVLNSESPDFIDQVRAAIKTHNPNLFFDAVTGELTMKVFKEMPKASICYLYGILAGGQVSNVNAADFIFDAKQLRGILLLRDIEEVNGNLEDLPGTKEYAAQILGSLKTEFIREITFENISEAVEDYKKNLGGKVLIICSK
eukprot:TRINITY_DN681_c0_g4_i1.p1 TRINITY_DN681_c0_g4~~TRINITY_DN681_c0_g4_i1.p1  ORF type:complete len:339 (-),score=73.32 TRINITY_DN681_c0_g4_i1:87-1103(-)